METNVDETRALDEVTERLVAQFPQVPSASVRAIVTASWADFTGKPIRDVVPVLAERTARQRLTNSPR